MKYAPLLLLSLTMLAACHASPANRYYALSPSKPNIPASHESVSLSTVTLPGLLDRPQMILKSGPNEIRLLEYNRWAEPLDSMISRVLTDDLAIETGAPARTRRISVAIDEFDADENGQVTLKATWTVQTAHANASSTHLFQKSESTGSSGTDAIVATMSRLLGDLAAAMILGNTP